MQFERNGLTLGWAGRIDIKEIQGENEILQLVRLNYWEESSKKRDE